MSRFFNPFGTKSVIVRFPCSNCDNPNIVSDEIGVPSPDYSAEKASESYTENDGFANCQGCGTDYEILVYAGYGDGYVEVENVDSDDVSVEEIDDPEEIEYYEQQYKEYHSKFDIFYSFSNEFDNLKKLLDVDLEDEGLQRILYRQIYIAAVATMETFLADCFINFTLEDPENLKRFVRSHPELGKRRFDLRDIFEQFEKIKETSKAVILDTIYHDLPKVKKMYQATLQIDFPPMGDAFKCVLVRHDLVHRNGKTKKGDLVALDKEIVAGAIATIEQFVDGVAEPLGILPPPEEPPVDFDEIFGGQ